MLFNGLAASLADAPHTQLLIGAHWHAIMRDTRWLAALCADHHHVRGMQRHGLLDDARRHTRSRTHMLLSDVQAIHNYLVIAWHRPLYHAALALILASQHQDVIALMDV